MAPAAQTADRNAKKTTDVAKTGANAGVPDYLQGKMTADAGAGVSTDASDNQVPLIYILDAKSPQCDQNDPRYIDGARAGSIWLRNYHKPIVGGNDGVLFQHCYFSKDIVEWRLRENGGGFVGRHPLQDGEEIKDAMKRIGAVEKPHPENPKRMRWILPSGNEVKETRYHAGYVSIDGSWLPYVIPFSSTGHTVSRNWMFTMMSRRMDGDKIEPAFARLYKLTTIQRQNPQGKWYSFQVADAGYVPAAADYERGKDLHEAFKSGAKVAAAEADDQDHETDGGDANQVPQDQRTM